jgi:glycogen phosphorylase
MSTKGFVAPQSSGNAERTTGSVSVSELLEQYGCGPIPFVGSENAFYERHLVFDRVIDPKVATARERFEAFSRSVRDILAQRWVLTKSTYEKANAKRIYYLSMEFLIGRSLANNITNLMLDPLAFPNPRKLNRRRNPPGPLPRLRSGVATPTPIASGTARHG